MKSILLLVHDDEGQVARLRTALHLVRALNGHLSCMDVSMLPMPIGDYFSRAGFHAYVREEQERESKNKAHLIEILAREHVSWDWQDVTGNCADALVNAAILSDLIVVSRQLSVSDGPDRRGIANELSLRARTPVLAVPDDWPAPRFTRALVAWDGRAACGATLRACVPILALAEHIQIFQFADNALGRVHPAEAAAYLKRHGMNAEVRITQRGARSADVEIQAAASAYSADYVMMGAHNHARLRDLFGSVSRRMLGNARMPLCLGH